MFRYTFICIFITNPLLNIVFKINSICKHYGYFIPHSCKSLVILKLKYSYKNKFKYNFSNEFINFFKLSRFYMYIKKVYKIFKIICTTLYFFGLKLNGGLFFILERVEFVAVNNFLNHISNIILKPLYTIHNQVCGNKPIGKCLKYNKNINKHLVRKNKTHIKIKNMYISSLRMGLNFYKKCLIQKKFKKKNSKLILLGEYLDKFIAWYNLEREYHHNPVKSDVLESLKFKPKPIKFKKFDNNLSFNSEYSSI